ncbi:MAG: hypothetical protein MUC50_20375 [Myxococcota bacterium]|jgi:hypothetical protein|nr:hypothetical protein [Myxococcota bacterium]
MDARDHNRPASSYSCEHYAALPGEKRCREYGQGGTCALSDGRACVEWLKAKVRSAQTTTPSLDPKPETDLLGHPLPTPKARTKSAPKHNPVLQVSPAVAVQKPEKDTPPRGLTTEDIESFKALGVEVCIHSEALGDLWLVPSYTGEPRQELTPEHALTLLCVLSVFPDSRVVAFEQSPPASPAKEGIPT